MSRQRIIFLEAGGALRTGPAGLRGVTGGIDEQAAWLLGRLLEVTQARLVLLAPSEEQAVADRQDLCLLDLAEYLHPTWWVADLDGVMPWIRSQGTGDHDVEGWHVILAATPDEAPPIDTVHLEPLTGLGLREYRLVVGALNGVDERLGVCQVSQADYGRVLDAFGWRWLEAVAWLHAPSHGDTMSSLLADPARCAEAWARLPEHRFRREPEE
ncbi:Hypothetical protein RMHFA_05766 [Roseomonas mucosa]|uniref:hypothetical protein n=1 Tax=Roseomonas TaxID=125216 RepID=UPI000F808C49|nr:MULTISPECIES: hypothetical protein [Roseomonas]UZO97583.1 Hypothetical protein RMHFA_05766 [Roseomonas mucosa]HWL81638.1 hypothetical protein [Roseomonas sp.]